MKDRPVAGTSVTCTLDLSFSSWVMCVYLGEEEKGKGSLLIVRQGCGYLLLLLFITAGMMVERKPCVRGEKE